MAQIPTSQMLHECLALKAKANADWRDAFQHTSDLALKLGFPYLIYAPVRAHADACQNWSATTYPAAWQEIYVSKQYLGRNPVRQHTLTSYRPFTWRQLEGRLPRSEGAVFLDCRDAGMADGVVVPIHGPQGQAIAVGFACEHADAVDETVLPLLNLFAHQLYQSQEPGEIPQGMKLTPRERELMQLLLDGMDNLQIADRLSLSDNSVEWHLKNIYRKLDVRNRTAAAVKAMKLGLVYV